MGLLVDGKWKDQWYDTRKSGGKFEREQSQFHGWVSADGSSGPDGQVGYTAESGRYHLYVSLACPWAHRTLIFRKLKQLEEHIGVTVVVPEMLSHGWEFSSHRGYPDHLHDADFLHQIYTRARSGYTGRVTVPVLWDTREKTIVNNESSEIIRMFNSSFNHLTGNHLDFYPESMRREIEGVNEWVYHHINNGVYKCGFATTQTAYEEAFVTLFDALDKAESILQRQPFLAGGYLTEADWRLFTTLIRFDPVYVGHFKCNLRRVADYPAISAYLRQLYQHPGIAETVNLEHIKTHYYFSHTIINPTQVIPKGPELNWESPHSRQAVKIASAE
ncbi:glutathione-dependent reductase [Hahella sp. CCB-MM4]|uniref:glutathione S-transferase family protein n=1 Tax=Hahella sp. (strain CCB-MM4) TaxID=1926491 RepID=UPI000B9C3FDB|nr:glutathione S-transferase family protein [Hahella sp. CCB-MM4]OZG73291.1 glutathione-dependent reductase [Hahella sp. CCB-MM4]